MLDVDAVAQDEFLEQDEGFAGQVRAHGEYWRAVSPNKIGKGQHVHVTGRDGLTLHVDGKGKTESQSAPGNTNRESKPNQ